MLKYDLPIGDLTKGIVVPLKGSCPHYNICKGQVIRNWQHKGCCCPSFINQYGDIFCKNYKDKTSCSGYFIKDAGFQCVTEEESETWHSQRSETQFLMAIGLGFQSAEFTLNDNDIIQFGATLTSRATKRWHN